MALQLKLVSKDTISYNKGEHLANLVVGNSNVAHNVIVYDGRFYIALTEGDRITKLWKVTEWDSDAQIYDALHQIAEGRYEFT